MRDATRRVPGVEWPLVSLVVRAAGAVQKELSYNKTNVWRSLFVI